MTISEVRKKRGPRRSSHHTVSLETEASAPVVGIGASAGGMEAIITLLTELPCDTGFAIVIIMHLDPNLVSSLAEILGRVTSMPVVGIKRGMSIQSNHVYIIPPDYDIELSPTATFKMTKRNPSILHMPIDYFFRSLAANKKNKCIGIILSGMGSDGTLGLQDIRTEGGLTFAQQPSSAKYDMMPCSAIRSGAIDTILMPQEMAKELTRISTYLYIKPKNLAVSSQDKVVVDNFDELPEERAHELGGIIRTLRKATHFDFAKYKLGTINRRIKRRMVLCKITSVEAYADYLSHHIDEAKALAEDFLITVTRFFRDNDVFTALKERILPDLLSNHPKEVPFRVWVPGCATGEEAYSIAILLLELLEKKDIFLEIRIFATDISENALKQARTGFFSEGICRDVPFEYLQRYFKKVAGGYCVSKWVREQCIFSRHDLIRDPPFAKIDFLSCRNLLIYFNPELQKQVIPILHYALNEVGVLLLGRSEAPQGFPNLFSSLDKKSRIFLKKGIVGKGIPAFHPSALSIKRIEPFMRSRDFTNNNEFILKEAERFILDRYAPPCVLINSQMDIMMTRGKVASYLALSPGQPHLNIIKMASLELAMEIRRGIQSVKKSASMVYKKHIHLKDTPQPQDITLKIETLKTFPQTKEPYYLIEFEEEVKQTGKNRTEIHSPPPPSLSKINKNDRQENLLAEQHYQLLLEQFEATQEAMVTSNEELQSSNEELQSTNEELETAKEELQSSNEELSTVNEELNFRNLEITHLNKDLNNLLTNIDIPIILVDDERRIRNFTPSSSKILKLIMADVGRPIGDITLRIKGINLDQILSDVMRTRTETVIEITDDDDFWHKLIVKPYQNPLNKIEGAVVILLNINDLKRATEGIKKAYADAQTIIRTLPTPLLLIEEGLTVLLANEAFCETFQITLKDVIGEQISTLGDGQWNIPGLIKLIKKTLTRDVSFKDFEVEHTFPLIGRKTMLLNATKVNLAGSGNMVALLAIQDITLRKEMEYKKFYNRLTLALETGQIGAWELDLLHGVLKWDNRMYEIHGIKNKSQLSYDTWLNTLHPADRPNIEAEFKKFLVERKRLDIEYRIIHSSGEIHYVHTYAAMLGESEEQKNAIVIGTTLDVTEQKLLTIALTNEKKKLMSTLYERELVNKELERFAYVASHDLKAPLRGIEHLTTWIEEDANNNLSNESKENLVFLRTRVSRMSDLIEGILQYTRAGRTDLNISTVNIQELLDEVIETLNPPEKFTFHYAKNLPTFNTTRIALSQVFSNLISNAIKYNHRKKGRISIGVTDKKDFYEFFVTDNGPGIKAIYYENIFEMFQTVVAKNQKESSGIGLSIVKKIVEVNHGKISVDSEVGKRTTFCFTWPKNINY